MTSLPVNYLNLKKDLRVKSVCREATTDQTKGNKAPINKLHDTPLKILELLKSNRYLRQSDFCRLIPRRQQTLATDLERLECRGYIVSVRCTGQRLYFLNNTDSVKSADGQENRKNKKPESLELDPAQVDKE